MTAQRDLYRAALLTIAACFMIPLGDAIAKYTHETHGVAVSFVVWSRFVCGALLIAPFALSRRVTCSEMMRPAVILRGLMFLCTIMLILQAAARAPLAETFGGFFIAPLVSFVLAVLLIGERPGWRRWALIGIGGLGLFLVVRPDQGMTTGLALAVLAGLFYGTFLTLNRMLAGAHRPLAMLWGQFLTGAVLLVPLGLSVIPEMTLAIAGLVILSAITSSAANLLLVIAYQKAEATRLAPLVNFQLVGATLFGVMFFGALPGTSAAIGLSLMFLAGMGGLLRPLPVR